MCVAVPRPGCLTMWYFSGYVLGDASPKGLSRTSQLYINWARLKSTNPDGIVGSFRCSHFSLTQVACLSWAPTQQQGVGHCIRHGPASSHGILCAQETPSKASLQQNTVKLLSTTPGAPTRGSTSCKTGWGIPSAFCCPRHCQLRAHSARRLP